MKKLIDKLDTIIKLLNEISTGIKNVVSAVKERK